MRASEFIKESVTYNIAKEKEYAPGKKAWSDEEFGHEEDAPCWMCDGTGEDAEYNGPCRLCKGTKISKQWVSDAPELNVANANHAAILDMLGLPHDYSGVWTNDQLPAIMKKLVKLKNTDTSRHTEEPTTDLGKMLMRKLNGMDTISRGPTMHNMGRSQEQVTRYIDTLMNMVKYAQEHGAGISFG